MSRPSAGYCWLLLWKPGTFHVLAAGRKRLESAVGLLLVVTTCGCETLSRVVVDGNERGEAAVRASYDVVVVGSGFGGSVTACRLAQAGRSVGVLERGRRWSNTEFPRSPAQIARDAFWDPGHGHFGLVEYEAFDRMHVIEGCGVGGGSLHYFNVHVRPPDAVFDDDRWPSEIPHRTLPLLSRALGRGFSSNGDLLLAGTLTDRDV